ncbi:hypothetical protein AHIS1636_30050 [Arthrobacter mangrovi]|uniref:Uncharacterized protein n=1 Tax=Arthrobacter mangrovi TaxID=2966350 RepID=A0ABQ5MXB4_9MICC|nr:hypothetical protein AHIS1636_30050 [Arthrobacter mangrovi]
MPAASSGGFTLTKTGINSAGDLTLTGFASPGGPGLDAAAFVIVGRNSQVESEFPALLDPAGQRLEASACIPLRALDVAGDSLADVYFVSRGPGGESRTRVTWDRSVARWLPYPTKFGNLSLKRKDS